MQPQTSPQKSRAGVELPLWSKGKLLALWSEHLCVVLWFVNPLSCRALQEGAPVFVGS